jgi:HEAT repeats/HEAT repeat
MIGPRGRAAGRGVTWGMILALLLAAAACAPAHDVDTLFRDLQSNDQDARADAEQKLEQVIANGEYQVFLRGLDNTNRLYQAQSILYLAQMPQPEARAALRDLLRLDARRMLPFNPIRLRPTSGEPSDSRVLVAHLIRQNGGDPEAAAVLLAGIDDQQPDEILVGTCFAVGALDDPKGIPLLARLATTRGGDVGRAAVQALGQFKGPEALAALKEAVVNTDTAVRVDVVSSLNGMREPAALALLESLARSDPSPEVRQAALRERAGAGDRDRVVPFLIKGLGDKDPGVRAAALEALQRLSGQNLSPRPELWTRWWSGQQRAARTQR